MQDVPPTAAPGKSLSHTVVARQRAERPPPCRRCRAASWWNGWRVVLLVAAGWVAGGVERQEQALARAKCSACRRGFTCYPPGVYPRRQYQLDVVAGAVAAVALGDRAVATAAAQVSASATSVRRWTAWVATLGNAAELLAVAAQLDADGVGGMRVPAHEGRRPGAERAAQVLAALEQLGAALVRRGLRLAERTGLGRVLAWQHTAHGDVYGLVAGRLRLSPAMAPGGGRPMR